MDLAKEKFEKLLEEEEKLMAEEVCIRVIGNLSLLPQDLRKLIAKAMLLTKDNTRSILNVAFAYTSRDEIVNSIQEVVKGVRENQISIEDIDEELLSQCMYSHLSPDPDILIRTSGEVRLSDFLLWQATKNTHIMFTNVLWPEFSIWHLLGCIFKFQRSYKDLKCIETERITSKLKDNDRVASFLEDFERRRLSMLEIYAKC